MEDLRKRIDSHNEKLKKHKATEAVLAGVWTQEAQIGRDEFELHVREIIKPAFDHFKATMREIGRDAVILTSLTDHPVQSIILTLLDRYVSFGPGKTLNLVSPKEDIAKRTNTKFYEIYRSDDLINVRQRANLEIPPITMQVTYGDLIPKFLENELTAFYERAYPATS